MTNPTAQPTAMPALARLLAVSTARPWRSERQVYDGEPAIHRIGTDEQEPWIIAEVAYDCQSHHDVPAGQEDAANAALLTLAANRLEELVEAQSEALIFLRFWLDQDLCECEGSHTCGRLAVERLTAQISATLVAIEAEAATAIGGSDEKERR